MRVAGAPALTINQVSLPKQLFFFWIRLLTLIGEILVLKNIKEEKVEKYVGRKFAVSEPEATENGNSNDRLWPVS